MSVISSADFRANDPDLGRIISSTVQRESRYVAANLLTRIDVDGIFKSGKLWKENSRPFAGQRATSLLRAEGAVIPLLQDGAPTTVSYDCQEYAGKLFLDRTTKSRSQYPHELRDRKLAIVRRAMLDDYERAMATLLFTGSTWGSNTTALTALSGYSGAKFGASGANEIADLNIGINLIEDQCDQRPTDMLIGISAWRALKRSEGFMAQFSANRDKLVLSDTELMRILADRLEIERIHVGRARSETANPGLTSSKADIWTDNVLLYVRGEGGTEVDGGAVVGTNAAVSVHERIEGLPSAAEANGLPLGGWDWESNDPPGTWIAGGHSFDLLVTEQDAGHLITDVV